MDNRQRKGLAAFLKIERGFTHWTGFKTAVDPEILLGCAHDLILNNLVHIGGGLAFIRRIALHLGGDIQTVAAVTGFSDHRHSEHRGTGQARQYIGTVSGRHVFNGKERSKELPFGP